MDSKLFQVRACLSTSSGPVPSSTRLPQRTLLSLKVALIDAGCRLLTALWLTSPGRGREATVMGSGGGNLSYLSVLTNTGHLPHGRKTHVTNAEFTCDKNQTGLSCYSVLCFNKARLGEFSHPLSSVDDRGLLCFPL